ncbi:MAG: HNH endonuclease [Candidatus Eisenbacteria sp.]|nr:HNH endonuclease [Candidatus Eisenbacteria bacterium]
MPLRPLRPCAKPGCPALVRESRFCPDHAKDDPQLKTRREKKRDPFYGTAAWRKTRAIFLRRNPICNRCGAVATIAHHEKEIKDGGKPLALGNLEALCAGCHAKHHRKDGQQCDSF